MKHLKLNIYFLIFTLTCLNSGAQMTYPLTKVVNQSDTYFGVQVKDPYRWLEDDNSSETKDWVMSQNDVTQHYFSTISCKQKIKDRLTELWNFDKKSVPFKKGNFYFSYINNGLQNQSVFCFQKSLLDVPTILLDPNVFSADGTTSLSGIAISKNAKYLAYGISRAGSDWVEIHFKDILTKRDLPDELKWIKFRGMSWKDDGIFYSRYDMPSGSELSQKNQFHKVYFHKLGTKQEQDVLVFEDKEHADYNFGAYLTDDENYLFISTSQSTSGEKLILRDLKHPKRSDNIISGNFNFDYAIVDNIDSTFYMLTNHNAPKYKLVSFSINATDANNWKTILPENENLLEGVRLCNKKIIANYLQNASSKLFCYDLDGKLERKITLPGLCKLSAFNSDKNDEFATYSTVQYISPDQSYFLDLKTWESKLIFKPNCKFNSDDYITEQLFIVGKSVAKLSFFITHKKELKMTPETPCFVYGYGGFNISLSPEFRIDRTVFLEAGGIYVVPNLRGGGEYGEDWHKAGTKCLKQNVFDDFISVCDFLVEKKYTSYNKIAIHGRSNGGLLVGAVMTQRPDICKVAIPAVGVLDMLRFHLFTIGRAWTVDYGCSDNQTEFDCLYKYSPLHNIKAVNYPATLVLTGDHDDRVVPLHSYKYIATL
jgi:prolyl oligopeptidase